MNLRSLSIKEKIFYAFLIYSFISFAISVTSFVLFREIEKIDKTAQLVSHLRNKIQIYIRLDNEFFIYEIINPEYYRTGHSVYIDKENLLSKEVLSLVDSTLVSERAMAFQFDDEILELKNIFLEKEKIRKEISDNIFAIGFKDYGYVGEMRQAAHYVENVSNINLVSLLMLRRHEKDYFLRNDSTYLSKHQKERLVLKEATIKNATINSNTKKELLKQIELYYKVFDKIVMLEKITGFKNNTGLTYKMRTKTEQIDSLINKISNTAEQKKSAIIYKIQTVIVIMVTLSIVLLLLLAMSFNFIIKINKE